MFTLSCEPSLVVDHLSESADVDIVFGCRPPSVFVQTPQEGFGSEGGTKGRMGYVYLQGISANLIMALPRRLDVFPAVTALSYTWCCR